jgi:hypothetical protein
MSRRLRFLPALLLLWWLPALAAAGVPLDAAPFTNYVAKAFEKAMPDADIAVKGPLQLSITSAEGDASAAFLATLHDYCQRNERDCRKAVATYVAQMASAADSQAQSEAGPKAVTVVVRPSRYVDDISKASTTHGGPVVKALAGDLWIIGAEDEPKAIAMLNGESAKQLGLTPKKALALGLRNVRKPVTAYLRTYAKKAKPGIIDILTGGPYQSSLLAFPKSWKAVVKAKGGSLLCALPAPDTVICSDGNDAKAIKGVHEAALIVMRKAERPLSAQVLAWQDGAWIVAGQ